MFLFVRVRMLPSSVKALRVVQSSLVSSTPSMTGLRPCLVYKKLFALPEWKTTTTKGEQIQKTCSMCSFKLCNLSIYNHSFIKFSCSGNKQVFDMEQKGK